VLARGLLVLSVDTMEALGHPAAIRFLTDRDEKLLGFRPAEHGPKTNAVNSRSRNVSAAQVLKFLGADLTASRRYPLIEIDGTWCIDLKSPGTEVGRGR